MKKLILALAAGLFALAPSAVAQTQTPSFRGLSVTNAPTFGHAPVVTTGLHYRSADNYGFIGDGSTSNATALTALAADATARVVAFGPGTFKMGCTTRSFAAGMHLTGAGRDKTTLKFDTGCTFGGDVLAWASKSGGGVSNLTIDFGNPTVSIAKINALVVTAYATNVSSFVVSNVGLINLVDKMAGVGGGATGGFTLSGFLVENSYIQHTPGTSWNQCVQLTTLNTAGNIFNPIITRNRCNGSGLQLDGDDVVATGNDIYNFVFGAGIFAAYATTPAVRASSRYCLIADNLIHDATGLPALDSNDAAHMGIENSCKEATISGNKIWNVGGAGIMNFASRAFLSYNYVRGAGKNTSGVSDIHRSAYAIATGGVGTIESTGEDVTFFGNIAKTDGTSDQLYGLQTGASWAGTLTGSGNVLRGATQGLKIGAATVIADTIAKQVIKKSSLVATTTALEFTGLDTASFKNWRLTCRNVTPSTADKAQVQFSVDNGASWLTTGSYVSQGHEIANGGAAAGYVVTTATGLTIGNSAGWDATQSNPASFEVVAGDLANSVGYKAWRYRGNYRDSTGGAAVIAHGSGYWNANISANALRVNMNGGATFYGACELEGTP